MNARVCRDCSDVRVMKQLFTTTLLTALTIAVTGCGYSSGGSAPSSSSNTTSTSPDGYQWKSIYRPSVRTVAVDIFTSKEFRRGEEFRLTTAIAKEIEAYTPYKIAPRDSADTLLEGRIRNIRRPKLSDSANGGVPNEQLFVVTVDFTWKDLRTGKVLVSREAFEQTAAYYPTLGEGSFVGSQEAAERLALAIVHELEADW
jgi:hypothetical protein